MTTEAIALRLQNLLYERTHLLHEVDACRSSAAPTLAALLAELPPSPPPVDGEDAHTRMLDLLREEAVERGRMGVRLAGLQGELRALRDANGERVGRLASLPGLLEGVHSAAEKLRTAVEPPRA